MHTGTNCEINFDDCASGPCDYGICKDGINRYDCVCKPGFTGKPSILIKETNLQRFFTLLRLSSQMRNMRPLSVSPPSGPKCNVEVDECSSNPCRNGGTCVDEENGFHCLCPAGFHEPYCYSHVDVCSNSPCVHGNCREDPNGYHPAYIYMTYLCILLLSFFFGTACQLVRFQFICRFVRIALQTLYQCLIQFNNDFMRTCC